MTRMSSFLFNSEGKGVFHKIKTELKKRIEKIPTFSAVVSPNNIGAQKKIFF